MLSEPTIRTGQLLFKWILIVLAGIGASMFLISFWDEVCDFFSDLPDLFTYGRHDRYAIDDPVAAKKAEQRRQSVKKWTKIVKRKNRLRAKYELAQMDRRTRRKAIDAVANTLATHEEILKSMYGENYKNIRSTTPRRPRRPPRYQ